MSKFAEKTCVSLAFSTVVSPSALSLPRP
jgi:hypothetical protein